MCLKKLIKRNVPSKIVFCLMGPKKNRMKMKMKKRKHFNDNSMIDEKLIVYYFCFAHFDDKTKNERKNEKKKKRREGRKGNIGKHKYLSLLFIFLDAKNQNAFDPLEERKIEHET